MTLKGDDRPRSLERKGMYSIFARLDPNERLPRELLKDARRYETLGRWGLAGALWLPALVVVLLLGAWTGVDTIKALGSVGLLLLGFVVFAISGKRSSR
jgi:hypothetical protein